MDDNHRLTEWLAYHFHVLPLDYLVVAVDPSSRTSPRPILDQWRHHGMTIVEWNNTDIFRGKLWEHDNIIAKKARMTHTHRQRQNMFIRNCMVHMKEVGRTWVMLTDPDEYLLFNGPKGSTKNYARIPYPGIEEEGSILKFLQSEQNRPDSNYTHSCISIPRMLFSAVESSSQEVNNQVPSPLQGSIFDTLRYRKHIGRSAVHQQQANGWSKSIIDMSRVEWNDIPMVNETFQTKRKSITIHKPLPKICPTPNVKNHETLLRINHYVGSWEAFSHRVDARASEGRDKSRWEKKANQTDETDDNIRPWISGFVEEYGTTQAQEMLKETGVFTEITGDSRL